MYERSVLPNGLRILTSTMPHTRSVSTGIFVGAGSRYEDDASAGVSHFLEHILFKGTERRPEPQMISGAIESVGGMFNASTDREATIYYAKVARDHFPLAIDVLTDMVRHPLFAPDEVERERGVIIEELNMTYDQPDALADLLIDEALWPGHPMGRDIGGTKESVTGLSRQAIIDYYARQYVPSNVIVSVAGNVRHEEVVALVDEALGDWKGGEPIGWQPVSQPSPGVQVNLGKKKTDQAHLCLALHGVSTTHADRYSVDMLNTMLGEGMTSRLFMEVRERRGLAYEVHSSSMHYRDTGAMVVYCGTDLTKVDGAVQAVLQEFARIRDEVPEDELRRAIEFAVGRLDLRLEDTRAVMGWLGGQELLRDAVSTPDEVVAELRAITPERVRGAARAYLDTADAKLSVVGPYRSDARFRKLLAA
ncbi:MAG: pitrilysin family protein [Dehalococcoidia bacterium]